MHLIMSEYSNSFVVMSYFHPCRSELASGVVSTALSYQTGRCPTDDLQLDTPVRITIEHSDTVKVDQYTLLILFVVLLSLWN